MVESMAHEGEVDSLLDLKFACDRQLPDLVPPWSSSFYRHIPSVQQMLQMSSIAVILLSSPDLFHRRLLRSHLIEPEGWPGYSEPLLAFQGQSPTKGSRKLKSQNI